MRKSKHISSVSCKNQHNAEYRETCEYSIKTSRENRGVLDVKSRESWVALGKESPKDGGSA